MSGHFVNCDWGTTRLRLRVVDSDSLQVEAEYRSQDGVASVAQAYPAKSRPEAYRTLLVEGLSVLAASGASEIAGLPILISGMASSSLGWQELPYAKLPFAVDGTSLVWQEVDQVAGAAGDHRVLLISGVRSTSDVLRGEETELVGLFTLPAVRPLADNALVIKPGTHCKHLRVRGGALVDFQTFMTGELFDVVARHSVLQHSIAADETAEPLAAVELEDLRAGVRTAAEVPLSAALFRVRTRQLLDGIEGRRNRAFLSGVLLGAELGYLTGDQLRDVPILMCATHPLDASYRAALEELGLENRTVPLSADDVELLSARGQALWWRNQGP
jgi:2-dehydro-3-deoxygalactonokinase